jgi:alkaline phosphatase D
VDSLWSAPISRRRFLCGAAAIAITACSSDESSAPATSEGPASSAEQTTAPAPSTAPATPTTSADTTTTSLPAADLRSDPFTLGVASGDPDATGVVLWTRLAPDPLDGGGMPTDDVPVMWEVSSTGSFATVEHSGVEIATTGDAHTVHAIAELPAGVWFYRFIAGGFTSPVGRTQPAPATDAATERVRLVSASCQNYQSGFYTAHRDIAEQQPDFLVWLGDYIYEGGATPVGEGAVRTHGTPEPTTLDEYRNRYALYKSDEDLQAAHAACPWFVIWDDHEVENNYAGTVPQDDGDAAAFETRRRLAYKVWWEHTPTRLPPPPDDDGEYHIYRSFQWGDLLGLNLLDGRQYRSDQACGDAALNLEPACPEAADPQRTMLGDEQEQWLLDTIGTQGTIWNAIGNQTVMADFTLNGAVLNYDQWDGYPASRQRLLDGIAAQQIANVIVLTGDIHLAGVTTVVDPGSAAPVAIEFVATSISSSGAVDATLTSLLQSFPNIVDVELAHRGYTLHEVTRDSWTAHYRIVEDAMFPDTAVTAYKSFVVDAGVTAVSVAAG